MLLISKVWSLLISLFFKLFQTILIFLPDATEPKSVACSGEEMGRKLKSRTLKVLMNGDLVGEWNLTAAG